MNVGKYFTSDSVQFGKCHEIQSDRVIDAVPVRWIFRRDVFHNHKIVAGRMWATPSNDPLPPVAAFTTKDKRAGNVRDVEKRKRMLNSCSNRQPFLFHVPFTGGPI